MAAFRSQFLGRIKPVWYGIAAIAIITAYFALSGSTYLFTYDEVLLAVLGAVALNFLVGTAGIVSLGNAGFMAAGAFATVYAMYAGIPFPADVIVGALAAGIIGLVFGLPAARIGGIYMAFATLAAVVIIDYFGNLYQTDSPHGGPAGFNFTPTFESQGFVGQQQAWAWLLFGIVAVFLIIASRLAHGRIGRSLRMIRDHEIVAKTFGINVVRYKLGVFAITSAVIGLQGGLLVHFLGSANTASFTLALTINYLAMVLIGGVDSIAGAAIGAAIVTSLATVVPNILGHILSSQQAAQSGPAYSTMIYGLLIVLFVAASPSGLIGLFRSGSARAAAAYLGRRGGEATVEVGEAEKSPAEDSVV
jgi:branched-chain amino acid transport system permease protein